MHRAFISYNYHFNSIKVRLERGHPWSQWWKLGDFNSIKVRLEPLADLDITNKILNFNSIKVRLEPSVNQILSIEATDGTNYKFVSWSTGSKTKKIQLTATGMNMGLTAFFKKNG